MLRSAVLVLSGNATAALLLLARNLIVARLIPVADYGVAATFAIAMAVVEMMSALGLQQQIVQAKNGEDPRFQAGLQGFQLLRGVVSAIVLFAIAKPMAAFLGIPEAAWAYQLLALVPVLNALVHFDIYRLNRQMRFWPLMLTGGVPALLSLLAVWPLAHWFGDWQVMLYAILLQAAVGAVTSHLVAERRWQLVFDRKIMAGSLRFGWPLLVNGILLFAVFNGEKLIVGRELGMEALAIFAMGVTLTLTPTLVMAKSATNFFLPQLMNVANDPEEFQRLATVVFMVHLLFSGVFVVGTMLLGPVFVALLLGQKYAALVPILTWLAILQGLRILKGGPSTVALARGQTENAVIANLLRIALLPLAWWVVQWTQDLTAVLALGILGEFLGAVVAFALVRWRLGLRMRTFKWPIALTILVMLIAGLHGWSLMWSVATLLTTSWAIGLSIAIQMLAALAMKPLWQYVLKRKNMA